MTVATAVATGILGAAVGPLLARTAQGSLQERPIPVPVPPVVGVSALLGAAFGVRYAGDWLLPAYLVLAGAAVVLTIVDLVELRLPNRVLGPTAAGVVTLVGLAAVVEGDAGIAGRAVLWGAAAGAVFLALHLVSPRGLGMGDVKLAALLGCAAGAASAATVVLALFVAFGAAVAAALVLLATRRVRGRDPLPFGPFLAGGTLVALLVTGG